MERKNRPRATAAHDGRSQRRSLGTTAIRTLHEFTANQCTDLAAGLTYYTVLALFPALLAIVSILGLFGQGQHTVNTLLGIVGNIGSDSVVKVVRKPIEGLVRSPAAPITFIAGILGALWSASGYVGAFGRAMNRIYGVREGRPIWKLRITMLGVTLCSVILMVVGLLALVSGPVAKNFGDVFGIGDVAATTLSIVQWPILVLVVVVILAVLYYWAPNVRRPAFRWMSWGAVLALLIWVLASVGFGFYVGNFAHYNATYGSLGGVIVFLLWIWITNNALLVGAQFDAELERLRELREGVRAEDELRVHERDTRQIQKENEQHAKDVLAGMRIREDAENR